MASPGTVEGRTPAGRRRDPADADCQPQGSLPSLSPVFLPGGDAAPDVPLGLVDFQNFLHLQVQRPVELGQALGDILMYGCK